MNSQSRLWIFVGPVLLSMLLFWSGCDNTVAPFAEEKGQFSIHGLLTLSKAKHFIRVKDLNDPVDTDSVRVLNATVTLENVSTGTTETLTDSIVTFNGFFTHNFRTDQDIQPGTSYRLRVVRPDGRFSEATATMPPAADLEIEPTPADTAACDGQILLTFQGIPLDGLVRISAAVRWDDQLHWTEQRQLELPKGGFVPWRIVDEALPESVLQSVDDPTRYCTELLDEGTVHIAYTRFGPDWPADSVLNNPVESSVKNGLGIFGGIQRDTVLRTVE